jgi:carboxymethylenebutenolidase
MTTTRTDTIQMPDGGAMDAYVALPDAGGGPGVLVAMEIFGVGAYIRGACERLAELGYVAMAPDLYWRTRPGAEFGKGQEELQEAFAAVQELDMPRAIEDAIVALAGLRSLPEVRGGVGVLGFCLGGTIAYGVAVGGDPATQDQYIPLEQSQRVAEAAASRPGWEVHIQPDGGHAFDNWDNPMFWQPEPAARAWELTKEFLARTLPVS